MTELGESRLLVRSDPLRQLNVEACSGGPLDPRGADPSISRGHRRFPVGIGLRCGFRDIAVLRRARIHRSTFVGMMSTGHRCPSVDTEERT